MEKMNKQCINHTTKKEYAPYVGQSSCPGERQGCIAMIYAGAVHS